MNNTYLLPLLLPTPILIINTLDPPSTTTSTSTATHHGGAASLDSSDVSFSPDLLLSSSGRWASHILLEAARAFSHKNTPKLHHLLWMLNELGSFYGDVEQKLAAYFNQALFSRLTAVGPRRRSSMLAAADRASSFDSTRKLLLKFQEVSPWTTFGHVACNGALIETFEGDPHDKIHIIDISTTFCTQWPTLLEALATRLDDTPHLTLTAVVVVGRSAAECGIDGGGGSSSKREVMREIGTRLEKFARLMGVPFKFNVIYHIGDFSEFDLSLLEIKDDEAIVVNCVNSLHSVSVRRREEVLTGLRRLRPRLMTVVEEEAEMTEAGEEDHREDEFMRECLRWFRVYFEVLEDCFPKTSNEKLMLERAAGRALVDLLACFDSQAERRSTAGRWTEWMRGAGFRHVAFSEEVCGDVKALLRRYKEGWSMAGGGGGAGMFLSWRDQPLVWTSAWKP